MGFRGDARTAWALDVATQQRLSVARNGVNWTEPMAQNFWTLVLLLGLRKTRLDFFHGGMDRDETLGTRGQSFISSPVNLTTTPQPLMREFPELFFLHLRERTPFPLATPDDHGGMGGRLACGKSWDLTSPELGGWEVFSSLVCLSVCLPCAVACVCFLVPLLYFPSLTGSAPDQKVPLAPPS